MSYISINGRPACTMPMLPMAKVNEIDEKFGTLPVCVPSSEKLATVIEIFEFAYPDKVVEVVEGGCPAYDEENRREMEQWATSPEDLLRADIAVLKEVLRAAVNDIAEYNGDGRDGRFIRPTCNECTEGCTPARFDKGPCWYHHAIKLIGPCGVPVLGPDDSIKPCVLNVGHVGRLHDSGVR